MASPVVAAMVKELCREITTLPRLRPYASKPFFLPCSSHPLQFLCTCGSSIVAHCHLSFLWVNFVLTLMGRSLFMTEDSIPLESLPTQFPFSTLVPVTSNSAASHNSFPFLLRESHYPSLQLYCVPTLSSN
jgi:hypothetical protein